MGRSNLFFALGWGLQGWLLLSFRVVLTCVTVTALWQLIFNKQFTLFIKITATYGLNHILHYLIMLWVYPTNHLSQVIKLFLKSQDLSKIRITIWLDRSQLLSYRFFVFFCRIYEWMLGVLAWVQPKDMIVGALLVFQDGPPNKVSITLEGACL